MTEWTPGHGGDMSPLPPIAIIAQGGILLAGASRAEAARVWDIIGPMAVPSDPEGFALLVRDALDGIRREP